MRVCSRVCRKQLETCKPTIPVRMTHRTPTAMRSFSVRQTASAAVEPLGQMTEIGPHRIKAALRQWGKAIADAILGVRVVKCEVYAILYQFGKTDIFWNVCKLWFTAIPSFLSKSKSASTLREGGQCHVIIIHNSGESCVNLMLKVGRAVDDILESVVDTSTWCQVRNRKVWENSDYKFHRNWLVPVRRSRSLVVMFPHFGQCQPRSLGLCRNLESCQRNRKQVSILFSLGESQPHSPQGTRAWSKDSFPSRHEKDTKSNSTRMSKPYWQPDAHTNNQCSEFASSWWQRRRAFRLEKSYTQTVTVASALTDGFKYTSTSSPLSKAGLRVSSRRSHHYQGNHWLWPLDLRRATLCSCQLQDKQKNGD